MKLSAVSLAVVAAVLPFAAASQVVGVAVDSKVILKDGASAIAPGPHRDSAVFFRFADGALRRFGEVQVPASYLGAPSSVAVSGDGKLALVSSSTRLDPNDPGKYADDDRVSVIDLSGKAPKLTQTLALGVSPSSIKLNPAGTMALVPSSPGNSVTVLSVREGKVAVVDTVKMAANMGALAAGFAPDGKHVLVTQADGQRVALYAVDNDRLRLPAIREMGAGITPFTPSYCGDSGLAVVANFGVADNGNGDVDTVSLIDLSGARPRIVDTVSVGSAPEDVACSPDGRYAVAAVQNMSNRPKDHPFYSPDSLVVLLKIEGRRLRRLDQAPFGAWAEGIGFADDSRTLFAQSIVERAMYTFRIEDDRLQRAGAPIVFANGAPVGIGVAGR
ncbi:lactonase, 7-bladed beta-propeller family protein [Lysobacter capsici]|uniref:YncE family protein n=1 Tax=Lysobacter capsici TaxID=435897 RepID=UPI000716661A|nr:YncE family protein [Lysobacter capsici]ALN87291.1 lactonase, 7-bladed beta-propeller family protein [Lysobacter capsici]